MWPVVRLPTAAVAALAFLDLPQERLFAAALGVLVNLALGTHVGRLDAEVALDEVSEAAHHPMSRSCPASSSSAARSRARATSSAATPCSCQNAMRASLIA